jgi:hypothetical protein
MTTKRRTKPPHAPTTESRAQVTALCSYGVPHHEISAFIGIDPKTLRKHYRGELDTAQIKANANVAKFLYSAASGKAMESGADHADCIRAAMFWAKTRMGWRETSQVDHTSSDGSMTPTFSQLYGQKDVAKPKPQS